MGVDRPQPRQDVQDLLDELQQSGWYEHNRHWNMVRMHCSQQNGCKGCHEFIVLQPGEDDTTYARRRAAELIEKTCWEG